MKTENQNIQYIATLKPLVIEWVQSETQSQSLKEQIVELIQSIRKENKGKIPHGLKSQLAKACNISPMTLSRFLPDNAKQSNGLKGKTKAKASKGEASEAPDGLTFDSLVSYARAFLKATGKDKSVFLTQLQAELSK